MALQPGQIVLRNVRLAFAQGLWEPRASDSPNAKPKYNCRFIIEPGSDNDKAVMAAIREAAEKKFKGLADTVLDEIKGNKNCNCYLDGARCRDKKTGKIYDGFEGMKGLTASRRVANGAPGVVDGRNRPVTQESGIVYSGCYVNAVVAPWAYINENNGISCELVLVQFAGPGDAFGGGSVVDTNALPAVEGAETASDGFDDDTSF